MTILRRSPLALGLALGCTLVALPAFAGGTAQKERGEVVKKLYTPVRTLESLKSQYRSLLGELRTSRTAIAAQKKAVSGKYPFHGDAEGSKVYYGFETQEKDLDKRINTVSDTLRQVVATQKQMAGVVKTALRDGSSETIAPDQTKILQRTRPGFGKGAKVVAEAVVEQKGDRFAMRMRHTQGRGTSSVLMPGYKDITAHGIDVDLSPSQLVVSFDGHYTESGSPTKVVKTFDLNVSDLKAGFAITQVRKAD